MKHFEFEAAEETRTYVLVGSVVSDFTPGAGSILATKIVPEIL